MKPSTPSPRLIYNDPYGEADTKSPARDTRGNLESAITLLREEGNSQTDAGPSLSQRFRRQEEISQEERRTVGMRQLKVLEKWADKNRLILSADYFRGTVQSKRPEIGDGSEHTVWGDPSSARVIKLTHADVYGNGAVGHSLCSLDYLAGLQGQNTFFFDDIRLEGFVWLENELPQFVISQPFVLGREATHPEIRAFFTRHGFKEDQPGSWIRTHNGQAVHVWDAVPYNVFTVDLSGGRLVTVTLDVQVMVTRERSKSPSVSQKLRS